jgi:hypothetical protein
MHTSLPYLAACSLAACALGFAPAPMRPRPSVFQASFTRAAKDVTRGYGPFAYEATGRGWRAGVSGGKLRMGGDHPAGDQRLVVTARRAIGKPRWPDAFVVTARLGGGDEDSGAWHVGVSVGDVKVLFHPGYEGGAFRVEAVGGKKEFVGNQDVGFTPAAGAMHKLTLKVRRAGRVVRFEAELADANGRGVYRKAFEVLARQAGNLDRVGLERSGRQGGDGLFASLSVEPGK